MSSGPEILVVILLLTSVDPLFSLEKEVPVLLK